MVRTPIVADSMRQQRDIECLPKRRNLTGACLAHLLHDGYTDQLYALLTIWQLDFGLSYAGLAVVRAL
jgi:FSR family fosmidomycin resistance protein-like MFS transporter